MRCALAAFSLTLTNTDGACAHATHLSTAAGADAAERSGGQLAAARYRSRLAALTRGQRAFPQVFEFIELTGCQVSGRPLIRAERRSADKRCP